MAILATDNFNRADNTDLGASWDVMTSEVGWKIVTNQCVPGGTGGQDATETNNSVTWPDNQYAQVTWQNGTSSGGVGRGPGVCLRGATGARTYYRLIGCGTTGNHSEIAKVIAGAYTQLATATGTAWAAGDVLYGEVNGSTLVMKRNGGQIATGTDATIASGRAGVSYSSTTTGTAIDDWEGGDLASVFTPLVKNVITQQAINRAVTY